MIPSVEGYVFNKDFRDNYNKFLLRIACPFFWLTTITIWVCHIFSFFQVNIYSIIFALSYTALIIWFTVNLLRGAKLVEFQFSMKYRCVQNTLEKLHIQNTVQLDDTCYITKSYIYLYRHEAEQPFICFSQDPLPKLKSMDKGNITKFEYLSKHEIVFVPLNTETTQWLSTEFGIKDIPEYPQVLCKIKANASDDTTQLWS